MISRKAILVPLLCLAWILPGLVGHDPWKPDEAYTFGLVYQILKAGLHVYAFKPINKILSEQWIKEPLYKKHAKLLDENKKLPDEILEEEAKACADFLNSLETPLTIGGHAVKAQVVNGSAG